MRNYNVIHEAQIKVGGSTKAPDYAFKVGKERIFFLEAKKPSRDLKHDPEPAFQLRRYAYSAKLPVSVLTDFEELSIYDTRIKPAISDKSHVGRMLYYNFTEYVDKWEEISETFSKESVMRGAFDRFVDDQGKGRGTTTLDRDFLNSLDEWRIHLARNIALRNPDLSERELNYAVQMTIDRLIFLRMAEDRGIETYGTLQALQNGENCYRRLVEVYYRADERYNSGLFHFEEKDGAHPDLITPSMDVDNKVLKEIIRNVYYPCPYEFSQLPVEVLGNAYEQFLGKRITLTSGHRAKIEEKPEVRKAGGVYYTPQYIVDYIVEHTVGELVKEKSPKQVSELRILDPACGSGSFLLGAYQYLLDWHLKVYIAENQQTGTIPSSPPAKGQRARKSDPQAIFQDRNGQWALSTSEKKRILLNNIYGVDIDANAVEVTKLSLLLKVLEDENSETLHQQLGLWHERALPNLSGNIKCGNSLIGPDYYDNQQSALFDIDERIRVNAFDWRSQFADVFTQGGFDAVIGNPPYIPIETMTESEKEYYRSKYVYLERKWDSSIVFIIAMLEKMNSNGYLSYISSLTWQTGENYNRFREFLFEMNGVEQIINLPFDVFKSAYVDTGIYIFRRNPLKEYSIYRFPKKVKITSLSEIPFKKVDTNLVREPKYKIVLEPQAQSILNKALESSNFISLGEISVSTQGLTASRYDRHETFSNELFPFLEKGQVYRYQCIVEKLTFVPMDDKASLVQYYESGPKLLVRRIINRQNRLMATCYPERLVHTKDLNPFIINENYDPLYILGILNSSLISYLYVNTSSIATKDDFRQTTLAEVRELPIRKIDLTNPNDKAQHDYLVIQVQQMLDLHKALAATRDPHTSEQLERQIEATDTQIDRLVYELYQLTEEEIKVVEEAIAN